MPLVRLFALVLGIVYLLLGLLGFVPMMGSDVPLPGVRGPFNEVLLGLFAVNWFHNLVHVLVGVAGLAVFTSFAASRVYALVVGIAFAGLFLLGILSGDVGTLGGLLPLNGADDILHGLTGLVALGIYFTSRLSEPERGAANPRA